MIKFQDLLFDAKQLAAQSRKARAHKLRRPFITRIGNGTQQFFETSAADRRGNTKFGEVSGSAARVRTCPVQGARGG